MGNSFTTTSKEAPDAGSGAESISPTTTTSTDVRIERSSALASKRFPHGSGDPQLQQQGLASSWRAPKSIHGGMPTLSKNEYKNYDHGGRPIESFEWTIPDLVSPQLDPRRVMMPVSHNDKPGPIGPKVYVIVTTPAERVGDNPLNASEHVQHLVMEAQGRTVFYADLDQPLAPLLSQAFAAGGLKDQFQADNIVNMINDLDKEKLVSNTMETDMGLIRNRITKRPMGLSRYVDAQSRLHLIYLPCIDSRKMRPARKGGPCGVRGSNAINS